MRKHKYNAKKTTVDGITFDSQKEAKRWGELLILQRGGYICHLERQFKITLVERVRLHGETRKRPDMRLVVDFVYYDIEKQICRYEDAKGFETPISRMKRHMALALHGINVEVV
jgi:hypothetical protein